MRIVRGLIVVHDDAMSAMNKIREAQIQKAFGMRVRDLRKQKGLSQEGLALTCGLDRTYIGGVERGERNISLLNIYKIARALGVSSAALVDDGAKEQQ
jgi:transcriptional regulator with XRE-family HTH domain